MVTQKKPVDQANAPALQVIPGGAAGLEEQISRAQEDYNGAVQRAAPYAMQLQLLWNLAALRALRLAGETGVKEASELTSSTMQQMAQTGFITQVLIDGSRGKVDDAMIAKMQEVQGAYSEGSTLLHAMTTGALLERVQAFRPATSSVGSRDVITAVALGKLSLKR